MIPKAHTLGTHRARTPEETLKAIAPHLRELGITRCANVTGLDRIGIPTCCAIRPESPLLQVSNGKGLRLVDAKVSAIMEAIELFHAEHPPLDSFNRASEAQMRDQGRAIANVSSLQEFNPKSGHSDKRVIDWVAGRNLLDGTEIWLPAAAVYVLGHLTLFDWTSNGLASGNNRTEAALHAVLELLERHALAGLSDGDDIVFDACHAVDLETITDDTLQGLVKLVTGAGVDLVLLTVPTPVPAHTFLAAFIDPDAFSAASQLSFGFGTHLSPVVAATRAITEAAQTRLTYIHGARNDLRHTLYLHSPGRSKIEDLFKAFPRDHDWQQLADHASADLETDLRATVQGLVDIGLPNVYDFDLTRPQLPIAVVRVFVEGIQRTFLA